MKHKGCGGEVKEDCTKMYHYVQDSGKVTFMPALRCMKCGAEIGGDREIELEGDKEDV